MKDWEVGPWVCNMALRIGKIAVEGQTPGLPATSCPHSPRLTMQRSAAAASALQLQVTRIRSQTRSDGAKAIVDCRCKGRQRMSISFQPDPPQPGQNVTVTAENTQQTVLRTN